jgi:hypothetical protein
MTNKRFGGTLGSGGGSVVTQNNSAYVLIAETMPTAGTKNAFSGMTNPVMIDGTTTLEFADIPQTYRDLKIVFDSMGHSTENGSGYRIMMTLNGDTNTSRYYTRADNRDTTWNADNVNYFYFGYMYRPENTTWTGTGEIYIPGYSKTRGGWNQRTFWGFWSHMNQSAYLITYKFDYYNNADADKAITKISFRNESDVGYRRRSKISLYGIGAV